MNVRLRRLRAADSAQVLAWRNSPQVNAYMYTDEIIVQDVHDRWFQAALEADDRQYWIVELDDRPVGLVNLARIDRRQARCEWAYYLVEPDLRGKGVGSCIGVLICRHVFETLDLNKLWGEVLAGNVAGQRRLERLGFTREALFRDHVRRQDGYHDVHGFGLLARDWATLAPEADRRLEGLGYDARSLILEPV